MKKHAWRDIAIEKLGPLTGRQAIHAGSLTVARIHLAAGAVVPRHAHANEQVTILERGRLRFVFDDGESVLEAGELMEIPPFEPHRVEALEDSLATDIFSPRREDWIRGDDAYLRQG